MFSTVNTFVVRSLAPVDLLSMQRFARYDTLNAMQRGGDPVASSAGAQFFSSLPFVRARNRTFVALLDGTTVASVIARPQAHRYRWDILSMAATPRLCDDSERDCEGIWTALLEFAIEEAGHAGAKRLFASAVQHGAVYDALRAAAFEPYARFFVMRGTVPGRLDSHPDGLRHQEESDVWSIHQLYHHVTPAGVQYAEALTSATWELRSSSALGRFFARGTRSDAHVIETVDGIVAHCAISDIHGDPVAWILADDRFRSLAYPLAVSSARNAGIHPCSPLRIVIPDYTSELATQFSHHSFTVESERVALVRHTTSPALVSSRSFTQLADLPEGVPRSVPTYYHRMEQTTAATNLVARKRRTERIAS
jgi:hypothetical protein